MFWKRAVFEFLCSPEKTPFECDGGGAEKRNRCRWLPYSQHRLFQSGWSLNQNNMGAESTTRVHFSFAIGHVDCGVSPRVLDCNGRQSIDDLNNLERRGRTVLKESTKRRKVPRVLLVAVLLSSILQEHLHRQPWTRLDAVLHEVCRPFPFKCPL